MDETTRTYTRRIIATIILLVGIVISFLTFLSANAERIASQDEEYLFELTEQRAVSVNNLVSENLSFIRSTAWLYGQSLDAPEADVAIIREFEGNSGFDMLRFVDSHGDNYTSEGLKANLSDRAYFQAGMRGESGVTYVLASRVTGQRQIGFYAPVYYEDQIIGVMVGFYGEDYIRGMLEFELFGHEGEAWLCDADGTAIGATVEDIPENMLEDLPAKHKVEAEQMSSVNDAFASGQNVMFSFRTGDEEALAYAVPITEAGWMLIRCFPPAATEQILGNANRAGLMLLSKLIGLFAVYVLFMGADILLEMRRTREANRRANDISRGVSLVFGMFTIIDLETHTYDIIGGSTSRVGIPVKGDYDALVASVAKRIPPEEAAHREEALNATSIEGLRETLRDSDRTSLRVHAPGVLGEWLTYNYMVLERSEDGMPVRVLATAQDVTELQRKELEEQARLQEALDVAEQASNAKTEFLFNMSHDLRTPMNAIIGYTELAQHDGVDRDKMLDFIRKIDASSQHLLSLINDILEMSRIESGKMTLAPEECDLSGVVDEARNLFTAQMRSKGIHFMVDSCSNVHDRWVLVDRNRLNRVILNLVSNAYKFTPAGGTVRMTLDQGILDESTGISTYTLRVSDTGIGMSPEFVEKLFSPFERERTSTVSRTEGTGLGLSITKKIVDLMGGSISVMTEQGVGTEFVVNLPLPVIEHETEPAAVSVEDDSSSMSFEGVRVLLVEDQPVNMEIATMVLTHHGFVVDRATNGQEAVDKVAASTPGDYAVVLMDVQMPIMDGYEATRAIRALDNEALASIPIVAMTANAFAEDVQAALDAGMNAHVAKPIDVNKLMATLSEVLR